MTDIIYVNNSFKNISLSKHFHEDYSISMVYDGAHLFSNEKDRYKIVPGIIQVVNPYEIHTTENSSWTHINITPSIATINCIAEEILQKEVHETIVLDSFINDENASYLFISLFETFNDKKNDILRVENAIYEFLDYLLKNYSSIKQNQIVNKKVEKRDFSSTLEFIQENIANERLALEEIAKNAGISKFHFSREFKKEFGISLSNYIQIKKVNRVKELLKKDLPLSNIAYECGFNDQSYMIKVFKKYMGYTPAKICIF
jgi:AraC-like DNA-binding protein